MNIQFDSLKCVKLLVSKGVDADNAENFVEVVGVTELLNLYTKEEVDAMLSDTVKEVFKEQRRETNERLAVYERQLESRWSGFEAHTTRQYETLLSTTRWGLGLILTTVIAFGGYITTFLHLSH